MAPTAKFMSSLQRAAAALPPLTLLSKMTKTTKKRSIHSLGWEDSMEMDIDHDNKATKRSRTYQWSFVNPTVIHHGQITTTSYYSTEWIDQMQQHAAALRDVQDFFHTPPLGVWSLPPALASVTVTTTTTTTTVTTTTTDTTPPPLSAAPISSDDDENNEDDDRSTMTVWSIDNDTVVVARGRDSTNNAMTTDELFDVRITTTTATTTSMMMTGESSTAVGTTATTTQEQEPPAAEVEVSISTIEQRQQQQQQQQQHQNQDDPRFVPLPTNDDDSLFDSFQHNDDPRFVPLPNEDDDDDDDDLWNSNLVSTSAPTSTSTSTPTPTSTSTSTSTSPMPPTVVTIMFPNLDETLFNMTPTNDNKDEFNNDDDDTAITEVYNEIDNVTKTSIPSPAPMTTPTATTQSSYTACATPPTITMRKDEGSGFNNTNSAGDNNNIKQRTKNNIGGGWSKSSYKACATPPTKTNMKTKTKMDEGSGFNDWNPAGDDNNDTQQKKNKKQETNFYQSLYIKDIVKSMSVKQMKQVLSANNVKLPRGGVVEKQDLARLIWLKTDYYGWSSSSTA